MELFPDFSDFYESIYAISLWGFAVIQLFWIFFFYFRIAFHKESKQSESFPPVSIVIVAKNEEDNLFEFIPFILEQDYPDFEVIVVNHESTDNTEYILKAYKEKYPILRIINIEKGRHSTYGKKLPLTIGIKGAKHNHLLLTDADCKPTSDQWLKLMAGRFSAKKKIVLGYGPHVKKEGGINRLVRIDTTFIALNYLSYAKAGIPYMGVGRNLAYTKDLFLENSGFKSHYSIQSGDDDLFIQEVAKGKNYTICLSPKAYCYSDGKETWAEWFAQKSRHYTTTARYSIFKKIMLGVYPLSLLLFYISLLLLVLNGGMDWTSIIVVLFVLLSKWFILGVAFKKLTQKSLALGVLFWDLFYALFMPVVYYTTEQSTKTKWK